MRGSRAGPLLAIWCSQSIHYGSPDNPQRNIRHKEEHLAHVIPPLCREHVGLNDVLHSPCPSLPNLRRRCPFLVRLVHRYYGTVRQTITVPLLHIGAFIAANPEVARLVLFDLTTLDLLTMRGYRCRRMIARQSKALQSPLSDYWTFGRSGSHSSPRPIHELRYICKQKGFKSPPTNPKITPSTQSRLYGVIIEPVCTRLSAKSSSRCSVRSTSSSIRPSFRNRITASRSTCSAARIASFRRA
jgi:hypothetical protein